MAIYTKVTKPTGSAYTKVKSLVALYDDELLTYDDATSYYDGDSPTINIKIAKPTGASYTKLLKPI
jgi:hypothetical protein